MWKGRRNLLIEESKRERDLQKHKRMNKRYTKDEKENMRIAERTRKNARELQKKNERKNA